MNEWMNEVSNVLASWVLLSNKMIHFRQLQIELKEVKQMSLINFCFICSKSYSTKRKLQKHNYYLHPKSAAGVKTLKERNSHNASATAKDISEHKCQICGKIFKRAHNLKIHMNVHAMDPIERVQCAECTSTFSNHSSLNRHLRTVHNCQAPSIKCSYCDKEFQRRDNLMRHVSKFHTKWLCCIPDI